MLFVPLYGKFARMLLVLSVEHLLLAGGRAVAALRLRERSGDSRESICQDGIKLKSCATLLLQSARMASTPHALYK